MDHYGETEGGAGEIMDARSLGTVAAGVILGFIFIYYVLPTWYIRLSGKAIRRGSPLHPDVSLTFEGKAEQWSELLPILRSLGIRATFFVHQEPGEANRAELSRLSSDGHEWYPASFEHSQAFYRPVKGWLSLYRLWQVCRSRCTVVLWSATWNGSRLNPQRWMRKVRNGSVLRVKGGPADLQRFALLLRRLQKSGYRFCTLQQLESRYRQEREEMKVCRSPVNRFLFYTWKRWESFVHRLLNMEYVCMQDDERTLFRIRKRRYYGKPVCLADGQWLRRGEPILELHFNNDIFTQVVQRARTSVQLAATLIRMLRRSLPELSRYLTEHQQYQHVKAIYGITMIYRGADPFGFTVVPMPRRWWNGFITFYLRLYLSILHPDGRKRLTQNRDKLIPKRVIMSCAQLLEWYPPAGLSKEEPEHQAGHKMEREVQKGGLSIG
ncbi:MAG: hypothetical protein BAA01_06835 [Bacillus thermozeamaize]|uniref:Uncharacterized protein n=1 Tax=Bacillus thermozeamaize TaxID=230954 RepID=A0A1Y3PJZ3_9BACI|nr:MAG: hypothetical protein BAA01_06835 [Bacillus thermozeamaize]